MSVTIRLARVGRKNLPAYKIVVANTRDKRNGRFLDILGHYNPSMNPESFNIDKKKYEEWIKKGALITKAVEKLVKGEYKYVPYKPAKVEKKEAPKWAGPEDTGEKKAEEKKPAELTPSPDETPKPSKDKEPKPETKEKKSKPKDKKEEKA